MAKLTDYQAQATDLGGGVLDWSPALNYGLAQSKYVEIENLGTVYRFNSAVTIPAGSEVIGRGKPTMDYTTAGSTVVAVTIGARSNLSNVIIIGPGKATASKGLNLSGDHQVLSNIECRDFGILWYGNNANTYVTTARDCTFHYGGVAVSMPLDGSLTAGEKILFESCTFANSDVLFDLKGSFLDTFFIGCSFDYCTDYGTLDNGQHHFIAGHIETNSVTTTQGFLLRKKNGAQVEFTGVRFGMVGIEYVVERATEGTSGWVTYSGCPSNAKATGGASGVLQSKVYVQIASGQRTATFNSPFPSRTCFPTVAVSGHTGNVVRAVAAPVVTFDGASNLVTVTFPVPVTANTGVVVNFG